MYDLYKHAKCKDDDKHLDEGEVGPGAITDQIDMIYYSNLTKENSKIEISNDMQKIIFVNGDENYLFEKKDGQLFQNNIPEIKHKRVWKIIPYFDSFVFVISDEYDN